MPADRFRGRATWILAGCLVLGPAAWSAAQGDVVITEDETTGTRDCRGRTATIRSNENQLTLRNCSVVVVEGNRNVLQVGTPRTLRVLGNSNRVTWTRPPEGQPPPEIANLGNDNVIDSR